MTAWTLIDAQAHSLASRSRSELHPLCIQVGTCLHQLCAPQICRQVDSRGRSFNLSFVRSFDVRLLSASSVQVRSKAIKPCSRLSSYVHTFCEFMLCNRSKQAQRRRRRRKRRRREPDTDAANAIESQTTLIATATVESETPLTLMLLSLPTMQ